MYLYRNAEITTMAISVVILRHSNSNGIIDITVQINTYLGTPESLRAKAFMILQILKRGNMYGIIDIRVQIDIIL